MRSGFYRWIWTGAATVALTGSVAALALAQAPAAKAPAGKTTSKPAVAKPAATESADAAEAPASNLIDVEAAKLPLKPGGVDEEGLGQMVKALGLKPEKQLQRYDFAFRAEMEGTEWTLSMSAVLSQDQQSLWLMAWLDELPKSQEAVPRAALLRLLAENDSLGDGKMFAYIPNNRRFVMQRAVSNEGMNSAKFRDLLQDLGASVVECHPIWATANWVPAGTSGAANTAAAPAAAGKAPTQTAEKAPAAGGRPLNTATNDPKDNPPVRKK
ncbi:MAG: hypothetical protein DWH81_09955 [Planctomycetota bacterium]|nr:MAG: hypothetical protein DWH81_09955 [Planctomycetota bacterium]